MVVVIKDLYDGMGSVYFELAFKKRILEHAIQNKTVDIGAAKKKITEINNGMEDIKEGRFFTKEPLKTDGVIDIRTPYMSLGIYYICLHNQKEVIGVLGYRGYHESDIGDLGLEIYKEYQRQGYGTRAINLFGEFAYETGVPDFMIKLYAANVASYRIVDAYGGKLVGKEKTSEGLILKFLCPTKPRQKNKEKIIGEIDNGYSN